MPKIESTPKPIVSATTRELRAEVATEAPTPVTSSPAAGWVANATRPHTAPQSTAPTPFVPTSETERAAAVHQAVLGAALAQVPHSGTMSALRAEPHNAEKVAGALKVGLLSNEPQVVTRALEGLQVAAAYTDTSRRQEANFKGTGYTSRVLMGFPKLAVQLSATETKQLIEKLKTQSPEAVAIARMAAESNLVATEPADAVQAAIGEKVLTASAASGILPGSQGKEVPSGVGVQSFAEEFQKEVLPARDNLNGLISDTAKANTELHKAELKGKTCPFARGNHAKGASFDNAALKLDPRAPAWLKDVMGGDTVNNGKVRISESHTDPFAKGDVGHMPGMRFDFPIGNQTFSLTGNGGAETHEAKSIREHTNFSVNLSKPLPDGLLGKATTLGRVVKQLFDPAGNTNPLEYPAEVKDHLKAIKNASETSKQVLAERFDETTFFPRHTYNVGGRNVQFYMKVEDKGYEDATGKTDPRAYLSTVTDHVAKRGMQVGLYMIEMKEGDDPTMIEDENWKREGTRVGAINLPPQQAQVEDPTRQRGMTKAETYFDEHPFIPAGADKVAVGMGVLGRERTEGYVYSAEARLGRKLRID